MAATPAPAGTPTPPAVGGSKVKVQLRPIGAAPALARSKFRVNGDDPVGSLQTFLRSSLALPASEELELYVNSFAPAPSQTIGDLFACFPTGDELIVHYSLTPVYG